MELKDVELYEIYGGAITMASLNAVCRFIDTFVNLGRMVGSAARKLFK